MHRFNLEVDQSAQQVIVASWVLLPSYVLRLAHSQFSKSSIVESCNESLLVVVFGATECWIACADIWSKQPFPFSWSIASPAPSMGVGCIAVLVYFPDLISNLIAPPSPLLDVVYRVSSLGVAFIRAHSVGPKLFDHSKPSIPPLIPAPIWVLHIPKANQHSIIVKLQDS